MKSVSLAGHQFNVILWYTSYLNSMKMNYHSSMVRMYDRWQCLKMSASSCSTWGYHWQISFDLILCTYQSNVTEHMHALLLTKISEKCFFWPTEDQITHSQDEFRFYTTEISCLWLGLTRVGNDDVQWNAMGGAWQWNQRSSRSLSFSPTSLFLTPLPASGEHNWNTDTQ